MCVCVCERERVCGIVFLTLMINATTISYLLKVLGESGPLVLLCVCECVCVCVCVSVCECV